ncbi:ABC-type transport system permease protein (probable substrate branched-chain amino acids) [Haladaptatus paucihalophilus DX253]|uniref:ABC-type transport system permease protein (Probable substrate branched-chain amino acids) n=2 Tax=Haladaptatus TaxID=367188 RepID=E7QPJ7_HALPU|nr:ABC transporter permease [Haladaptatus paucihalophilus]EFW93480.1 ABC-type transport system permease protein (probable substrate branched-chain amino acids) [Haladaptatus paucihalophilus DX253]SHL20252.1 amino acid/amide ABC transporter membrane protein 1, HAAT family /amino acid/amide ABC transporter membrane protein 2, HAAT family [Haladaptatus paucihalophilus DX253]
MAGVFFEQLLNGLTIGAVYVLLAAGLSIIFGVMDVINFAHGEFFALGAYLAVAIVAVGTGGGMFWLALLVAPLVVALIAAVIERGTIRPLYGRNPLYHILLTFGLVLIFEDVISFVWGDNAKQFAQPPLLRGPVDLLGFSYSKYNFFVIAIGVVMAVGTWLLLNRTRFGLVVRAGAQDREMVRHLGIDIDRYYTLVFAFGAFLAALAGIVLGAKQSVNPGMGNSVIIPAFVIVVLGGLGSFRGAVVGGFGVGLIETFLRSPPFGLDAFLPNLEGLVIFLLMIGVLLVRPQGLFGNPEWESSDGGGELLTGGGGGVLDGQTRFRLGALVVALLALAPLGIGVLYTSYEVNSLLLTTLVWALFALSLDFVMGYAGLVSLGHVLFFGLGAYSTVLTVEHGMPSVFVALGVGMVVAALVAWAVGHLSIRVSGVYFSMITLGFAELFFQLVQKVGFTGGSEGLFGFDPVYGLTSGPEVGDVSLLGDIELYYYFVLAAVVGSYLLARRMMNAPFGSVLQGIRESEERASFIGYDVTAYKRRAFVVSGGLAGLAGGLSAIHTGGVSPSVFAWINSGEVIVMTILGGMGTLYGPMIGAGVFFGLQELLQSFTEQWQGILGVVFVLFVIYVPEGLVSVPAMLSRHTNDETGGGPEPVAEPDSEVSN